MNGQFNIGAVKPTGYFFGIAVLLGLLFAFVTPDSGRDWDLLRRLAQWQGQTVGPMAFLVACHIVLHRWERFDRLDPWFKLICSGLLGAGLFSPFALFLDVSLGGEQIENGQWVHAWVDEIAGLGPPVLMCWVAINAPWLLGFRIERRGPDKPEKGNSESREADHTADGNTQAYDPSFTRLLPRDIRSEIVRLKAELHYLEVVTRKGKALILYNLKDAINELANDAGIQPHRSYWVSKNHIRGLRKHGRQGVLQLTDGSTVPVSRRNMDSIKTLISTIAPTN